MAAPAGLVAAWPATSSCQLRVEHPEHVRRRRAGREPAARIAARAWPITDRRGDPAPGTHVPHARCAILAAAEVLRRPTESPPTSTPGAPATYRPATRRAAAATGGAAGSSARCRSSGDLMAAPQRAHMGDRCSGPRRDVLEERHVRAVIWPAITGRGQDHCADQVPGHHERHHGEARDGRPGEPVPHQRIWGQRRETFIVNVEHHCLARLQPRKVGGRFRAVLPRRRGAEGLQAFGQRHGDWFAGILGLLLVRHHDEHGSDVCQHRYQPGLSTCNASPGWSVAFMRSVMSASTRSRWSAAFQAGLGGHVRGVADHTDHLTVSRRQRRQHVPHHHVATAEVADGDATNRNLNGEARSQDLVEEGKR